MVCRFATHTKERKQNLGKNARVGPSRAKFRTGCLWGYGTFWPRWCSAGGSSPERGRRICATGRWFIMKASAPLKGPAGSPESALPGPGQGQPLQWGEVRVSGILPEAPEMVGEAGCEDYRFISRTTTATTASAVMIHMTTITHATTQFVGLS